VPCAEGWPSSHVVQKHAAARLLSLPFLQLRGRQVAVSYQTFALPLSIRAITGDGSALSSHLLELHAQPWPGLNPAARATRAPVPF
jgi:hypothetical protein